MGKARLGDWRPSWVDRSVPYGDRESRADPEWPRARTIRVKSAEIFGGDREEVGEIIRAWRKLGISLDPERVRKHIRELEVWRRRQIPR
jgi:hypothetical protein